MKICLIILRYEIERQWNGRYIDHPRNPATVEISLTCAGNLRKNRTLFWDRVLVVKNINIFRNGGTIWFVSCTICERKDTKHKMSEFHI